MRTIGQNFSRFGIGLVHAMLNSFLIMVTGKYFSFAWQRFGRRLIPESGEALLLVAIVISVVTIGFWIVPVRRRLAGAIVLTAVAIVAAGVGLLVLGTDAAG